MITSLYSNNHPRDFWHLMPDPSDDLWQEAIQRAIPVLGLPEQPEDLEAILTLTLGEAQFGPDRWRLTLARRLYYNVKPIFPRMFINFIQCLNAKFAAQSFPLDCLIEKRYAQFQWEIIKQIAQEMGKTSLNYLHFWPEGLRHAVILTHNIETRKGQAFAWIVADLEESLGFRSSFNFVPECYSLDHVLIQELSERGFEVGVHGLKHDGKLYCSENTFTNRAEKINHYLKAFNATGFRSPLMHRNPEWLQALQIEYDLSFFDTDPYQPMPGGCMSIWPFLIGHFIELPYTLRQDCTLGYILGERTPRLWLDKLEFIERYCGMALLNTHPDYLRDGKIWDLYVAFLNTLVEKENYWHALPNEAARWWRKRSLTPFGQEPPEMTLGTILLENDDIALCLPGISASECS